MDNLNTHETKNTITMIAIGIGLREQINEFNAGMQRGDYPLDELAERLQTIVKRREQFEKHAPQLYEALILTTKEYTLGQLLKLCGVNTREVADYYFEGTLPKTSLAELHAQAEEAKAQAEAEFQAEQERIEQERARRFEEILPARMR